MLQALHLAWQRTCLQWLQPLQEAHGHGHGHGAGQAHGAGQHGAGQQPSP